MTDLAAAAVSEAELTGGTQADTLVSLAGRTAPAVWLRLFAARTTLTLIFRS